jgi:hypothetical protein
VSQARLRGYQEIRGETLDNKITGTCVREGAEEMDISRAGPIKGTPRGLVAINKQQCVWMDREGKSSEHKEGKERQAGPGMLPR